MLQGKLPDTQTIASYTSDFQRAAFHKRPSPVSKSPNENENEEYFRCDIKCHPHEVDEFAFTLQKPHPITSQYPNLVAFPFAKATHYNSFMQYKGKDIHKLNPLN